jgi:hypothetical protein
MKNLEKTKFGGNKKRAFSNKELFSFKRTRYFTKQPIPKNSSKLIFDSTSVLSPN